MKFEAFKARYDANSLENWFGTGKYAGTKEKEPFGYFYNSPIHKRVLEVRKMW